MKKRTHKCRGDLRTKGTLESSGIAFYFLCLFTLLSVVERKVLPLKNSSRYCNQEQKQVFIIAQCADYEFVLFNHTATKQKRADSSFVTFVKR